MVSLLFENDPEEFLQNLDCLLGAMLRGIYADLSRHLEKIKKINQLQVQSLSLPQVYSAYCRRMWIWPFLTILTSSSSLTTFLMSKMLRIQSYIHLLKTRDPSV